MYRTIYVLTVLFILLPVSMIANDVAQLLPKMANEWTARDSDQYYNKETLYDYIDGGAELYISYGFNNVISRRYTSSGEPDIIVELFDMHTPRDAFGVFTNMREKNQNQYGQGSQLVTGSIIFWKSKYFISIACQKTTQKSLAAMQELGRLLDENIKEKGNLPGIMQILPKENLVEEGYCYFHHYIWLNAFYFISGENILNIDNTTDAVLAKYGPPDKRLYILLIQYKDEGAAQEAYDQFVKQFAPETSTQGIVQLEDRRWHTSSLQGKLIMAVFNAASKNDAQLMIDSIKNHINSNKIQLYD